MTPPGAATRGLAAALVAGYLAFLARQLARRNQTGQCFDGFSAQTWADVGADAEAVASQVRQHAPALAWHRATTADSIAAACAWVRRQPIRRAAVFLDARAMPTEPAGLQALAAAGRIDLWLLLPIAAPRDPNRHVTQQAERAAIDNLRAIFPPAGVHPEGLPLLHPNGARLLLAFASADRNARGRALGLKAAEFLIQGARRATPPTPPSRSPPAQ